jgi:hypothetical protein
MATMLNEEISGTVTLNECKNQILAASDVYIHLLLFEDGPRFEEIEDWMSITKEQACALLWKSGFNYDYYGDGKTLWIHSKGRLSSVQKPQLSAYGEQQEEYELNNF